MLRTRLTDLYSIDAPIVLAGMGFISMPPLVAAVSNAGGLGLLGVGAAPPAVMRDLIHRVKANTSRPFGVSFLVDSTVMGPLCTDEHISVCIEEGVDLVTFFWNAPPKEWTERLHQSGAKVWMQLSSVEAAEAAIAAGFDAIIVQGSEAGGHNRSTAGLFSLIPAVVQAVSPAPVIAAGGIADGRGVAAALALGADGVLVGSRFLSSCEANAHPEYKRRVVEATLHDVDRTSIFGPEWPSQPMRVLRNRVVREWQGRDGHTPPPPHPPETIGQTFLFGQPYAMPKFSAMLPTPETSGDFEEMCLTAGESAALIYDVRPASEILQEMVVQAERIIAELAKTAAAKASAA